MKSRASLYILASLFFAFSLFNSPSIFAVETQYDPTSSHKVRSVPENTIQTGSVKLSTQGTNQNETVVNEGQNNLAEFLQNVWTMLKKAGEFWLLAFLTGLFFFARLFYNVAIDGTYLMAVGVSTFFKNISEGFSDHGSAWFILAGMGFVAPFVYLGFAMNKQLTSVVQNLLKSTSDLYVRGLIALVAGAIGLLTKQTWQKTYSKLSNSFRERTHWQVGALKQDLLWVGGFAAVAMIVMGGEAVASSAATGTARLSAVSETIGTSIGYLIRESKSAFTETEKECKEREDGCDDLVDKGILLVFNYLPGTMPDLGMAETVIGMKKQLFHEDPEQLSDSGS